MPAMDEGAFILDYWAPTGTPLAETERMARELEKILSENPDVDAYVRRTGAENGPVRHPDQPRRHPGHPAAGRGRPGQPADQAGPAAARRTGEGALKAEGKTVEGRAGQHPQQVPPPAAARRSWRRSRTRSRTLHRAPAQDRADPDHGGRAERPVRGRTSRSRSSCSARTRRQLRKLAEEVGRDAREEGEGPRHQGGEQQRLRRQPRPDGAAGRRTTRTSSG